MTKAVYEGFGEENIEKGWNANDLLTSFAAKKTSGFTT